MKYKQTEWSYKNPIDEKILDQLRKELSGRAKEVVGIDEEGDLPIQVVVQDLTRQEYMGYLPQKKDFGFDDMLEKNKFDEANEFVYDKLAIAELNLSIAKREVERSLLLFRQLNEVKRYASLEIKRGDILELKNKELVTSLSNKKGYFCRICVLNGERKDIPVDTFKKYIKYDREVELHEINKINGEIV